MHLKALRYKKESEKDDNNLDSRTLLVTQRGSKLKIYFCNISHEILTTVLAKFIILKEKIMPSLTENVVWGLFDQCADTNTGSCMGQCPASCCYSANKVISKHLG